MNARYTFANEKRCGAESPIMPGDTGPVICSREPGHSGPHGCGHENPEGPRTWQDADWPVGSRYNPNPVNAFHETAAEPQRRLRERAQRAESELFHERNRSTEWQVRAEAAEAERDAAVDVLTWYADEDRYRGHDPEVLYDVGHRARAFLSTRTPRPQDDPSGIALLGDPWEG